LALATQCVLDSADPGRISDLLDTLAEAKGPDHWQQAAALDAARAYGLSSKRRNQPMSLAREPSSLIKLARGADPAIRERAVRLVELFTWPGAGVLAVTTSGVAPVIGAFVGALATIALVFGLSRSNGRVSAIRLLLVGVSLSYALSGFTSFVLYSTRDFGAQTAIMFWMLGGLGVADWSRLPVITVTLVIGLGYLWYQARELNALSLGDDTATALGLDPNLLRTRLFIICSLVVAAIVSTVGPIGVVGLVVPHISRLLIGADHRRVIPASLILGATYLIGVDIVARSLFAPSEIPVGVVTAMLGTPFFLWLIRRRGSSALKESA
jgi:ABC-type Fe3+-siderophore transport system permease subunit